MKPRNILLIGIIIFISWIHISCENKNSSIPKSAILNLPSLTAKDFETSFKDSGKLQVIMTAPLMEKYDASDKPYSEFTSGIKVDFYKGNKEIQGFVTAKYAKYTNNDNIWELKDSVVVINENKDKLETELLYWDQKTDLIYTDRFVRMTNADQVMTGIGFKSDSHLRNPKIKDVWATISLKDEE